MANVFDRFDQPTSDNVFDRFDEEGAETKNKPSDVVASAKKENGFLSDLAKFAKSDPILGSIENMLGFGTAAVAEPVSGIAGLVGGGDVSERAQRIQDVQQGMTYQPRSQQGQAIQRNVGEALQPVGEAIQGTERFLGDTTMDITGSPEMAAAAATIPTAALELIGLKGARRAKRATPSNITPEQSPRLKRTDIAATRGQADADFAQQKAENFLLEQSSEGGEQMRGYQLAQSREIRDYLEGVAPEQADNVGESVKQALELRESSAKFKRKQAYDKLAEVTKDTDVKLNTQVIADALPEAGELRDFAATSPGQYNAVTNLLTEFGIDLTPQGLKRAVDQGIDINELSVGNAERFRKRLNAIERADQTGSTSRITGPIKNALDSEFDLASTALQESGGADVALAAKNARLSNTALKTEFDPKSLTNQLIESKSYQSRIPKIEDSKVYDKMVARSTPVEEFERVVKSLDRAASKGKRAKQQIKSRMMLDLIDSGFGAKSRKIDGEQIFGANAFMKRFEQLEPKLKSVMTEAEFNKVKRFAEDAKDLQPPSGAMPKGSAGFFIDSMQKAGLLGLLSSIPYAGAASAEFLRDIGRTSADIKAFNKAVKAKPELKDAVNLLATDYPSLAVALGVPQLREEEEEE